MHLLSLLGRSGLACANGPDWLVSDNDVGPIANALADGSELSLIDSLGFATFAFVELLTNACHYLKVVLEGILHLFTDDGVALSKDVSALRVAEDDPWNLGVLEHLSTDLTSVCAVLELRDVLSRYLHLAASESLLNL